MSSSIAQITPHGICDYPKDMIGTLSSILTELCEVNDKRDCKVISKFHAACKPNINIKDYLLRVNQYAECSETCFILALIYIDRIQSHPDFIVNSLNIHRLLITAVMLAAKFFDDHYYNNAFYARIGGVSKEEMNQLELEFLFMIGFSLSVSTEEYKQYDNELRAHYLALHPEIKKPIVSIPNPQPVAYAQPQPVAQPPVGYRIQQPQWVPTQVSPASSNSSGGMDWEGQAAYEKPAPPVAVAQYVNVPYAGHSVQYPSAMPYAKHMYVDPNAYPTGQPDMMMGSGDSAGRLLIPVTMSVPVGVDVGGGMGVLCAGPTQSAFHNGSNDAIYPWLAIR